MTPRLMKWFEESLIGQICAVFIAAAIFWAVIIPIYWFAGGSMEWFGNLLYKIHLGFLVEWFERVSGI